MPLTYVARRPPWRSLDKSVGEHHASWPEFLVDAILKSLEHGENRVWCNVDQTYV
jgi:hypothetical protein